jgi:hypothetical protein
VVAVKLSAAIEPFGSVIAPLVLSTTVPALNLAALPVVPIVSVPPAVRLSVAELTGRAVLAGVGVSVPPAETGPMTASGPASISVKSPPGARSLPVVKAARLAIRFLVLPSVALPALPVRVVTVSGPPGSVIAPTASSRNVEAMPVRFTAPSMVTVAADAVGTVAPTGTLVKPPTSSVPPLVWMAFSRSPPTIRPAMSPPSRLVLTAVNGASCTVPAVVVIVLLVLATT